MKGKRERERFRKTREVAKEKDKGERGGTWKRQKRWLTDKRQEKKEMAVNWNKQDETIKLA